VPDPNRAEFRLPRKAALEDGTLPEAAETHEGDHSDLASEPRVTQSQKEPQAPITVPDAMPHDTALVNDRHALPVHPALEQRIHEQVLKPFSGILPRGGELGIVFAGLIRGLATDTASQAGDRDASAGP